MATRKRRSSKPKDSKDESLKNTGLKSGATKPKPQPNYSRIALASARAIRTKKIKNAAAVAANKKMKADQRLLEEKFRKQPIAGRDFKQKPAPRMARPRKVQPKIPIMTRPQKTQTQMVNPVLGRATANARPPITPTGIRIATKRAKINFCKNRPTNTKSKGGGSRAFVPHCKRG